MIVGCSFVCCLATFLSWVNILECVRGLRRRLSYWFAHVRKKCPRVDSVLLPSCCPLVFIQADFQWQEWASRNDAAKGNKLESCFFTQWPNELNFCSAEKQQRKWHQVCDTPTRTEEDQLFYQLSWNVSNNQQLSLGHIIFSLLEEWQWEITSAMWALRWRAEVKDEFLRDDRDTIHLCQTGARCQTGQINT